MKNICFICGADSLEPHVCSVSDTRHLPDATQEQKPKESSSSRPVPSFSSPMPMARKGQAKDSVSLIQERLKEIELDIAKLRNEKPLGIKEVLPSLIKEVGQMSSIISMTIRPTEKQRPKRERLAEEIADSIIKHLELANAASINIAPFIESKLSLYEKNIANGLFDKPEDIK